MLQHEWLAACRPAEGARPVASIFDRMLDDKKDECTTLAGALGVFIRRLLTHYSLCSFRAVVISRRHNERADRSCRALGPAGLLRALAASSSSSRPEALAKPSGATASMPAAEALLYNRRAQGRGDCRRRCCCRLLPGCLPPCLKACCFSRVCTSKAVTKLSKSIVHLCAAPSIGLAASSSFFATAMPSIHPACLPACSSPYSD